MNKESEYIKFIQDLIDTTIRERITWKKENPSTYFTNIKTSSGQGSIIFLQYIRPLKSLRFEILKERDNENESILLIDPMGSNSSTTLQKVLLELFETIEVISDKNTFDFLKDITNGISNK